MRAADWLAWEVEFFAHTPEFEPFLGLRSLEFDIVPQGSLNNLVLEPTLYRAIMSVQEKDTEIDRIKSDLAYEKAKEFSLDEGGALYFIVRLVVSRFDLMTEKVMNEAHDTSLSIHPGSSKMYLYIRQKYRWSKMKQYIARYIEECDVCRRVKAEH